MARITVEDCLENVENRFELVMVSSKRARQLQTGGKDPLVSEDNDKTTVIALREIAEGLIDNSILLDIPEVPAIEENLNALADAVEASAEASTTEVPAVATSSTSDAQPSAVTESPGNKE